jgi:hypothetical protein
MRRAFLIAIACAAVFDAAAAQRSSGVVVGNVLTEDGAPLRGAAIYLHRPDLRGAVSDSIGRFVITGVLPGTHLVRATSIGHRTESRIVVVDSADSVRITFRLKQIQNPISGSGVPLPDSAVVRVAAALLQQLLQDAAVLALVRPQYGAYRDTLIAWVPWATFLRNAVAGSNPAFMITSTCSDCVTHTSYTFEGGKLYTSGRRHVNVGLQESGDDRVVQFCVRLSDVGSTGMANCGGSSLRVRYFQQLDGSWRRIE